MKGLREKLQRHEGFTLVEMLLVVAIIAVLIMVSIPLVNTSLEKARHAVDEANIRDAITLGSVEFLTATEAEKAAITANTYGYEVDDTTHTGTLEKDADGVEGLCKDCKGKHLTATIAADGKVTAGFN